MFTFNEVELKIATIKAGLSYEQVASSIGMSKSKFYQTIARGGDFKRSDIDAIANVLKLDLTQVNSIFFTLKLA